MVKYDQDTPVQPRYDINAPDLYIPSMGYVTYVLLAGFMLGESNVRNSKRGLYGDRISTRRDQSHYCLIKREFFCFVE